MPLLNQQRPQVELPPPDPNYPAYRFHPDGRQMRVKSKAEEPGAPWGTKPFPKEEAPSELTDGQRAELLEQQLKLAQEKLVKTQAGFMKDWDALNADLETLRNAHERLIAEEAAVRDQRDQLLEQNQKLLSELAEKTSPAAEAEQPKKTSKAK